MVLVVVVVVMEVLVALEKLIDELVMVVLVHKNPLEMILGSRQGGDDEYQQWWAGVVGCSRLVVGGVGWCQVVVGRGG